MASAINHAWKKTKSTTNDLWKSANRYISGQKGGDFNFEMKGGVKVVGLEKLLGGPIKQSRAYMNFLTSKGKTIDDSSRVLQDEFKGKLNAEADKEAFVRRYEQMAFEEESDDDEDDDEPSSPSTRSDVTMASRSSGASATAQKSPYQRFQVRVPMKQWKNAFKADKTPLIIDGVELPRTAALAQAMYLAKFHESAEGKEVIQRKSRSKRAEKDGPSPQKLVSEQLYGEKGKLFRATSPEFKDLSGKQLYNAYLKTASVQKALSEAILADRKKRGEPEPKSPRRAKRDPKAPKSPYSQFVAKYKKDYPVKRSSPEYAQQKIARHDGFLQKRADGEFKKIARTVSAEEAAYVKSLTDKNYSKSLANAAWKAMKAGKTITFQ